MLLTAGALGAGAVDAPPSPSQPWIPEGADAYLHGAAPAAPEVPNHPLSLGELTDLTLRNNPDTRSSWQVAVQASASVTKAMAAFLPDLSAGVSFSKQYQKTDGALTAGPFSVPEVQIVNSPSVFVSPTASLSWVLWDFGASKAQYDAAKAGLIAANFQHNRTLQAVVHGVEAAYFAYDTARGALAAADAADDTASATLNATLAKRRNGLVGIPDEMQARQAEAQARLQRDQAKQAEAQAKAQLLELAGIPPSEGVEIAEQPAGTEPMPAVTAADGLVAKALANRPDIAARYAKLAAVEDDLKHTQRQFLPVVALSASVSRLKGEQSTLTSQGVNNPSAVQQAQISRYNTSGYVETASGGISVNMDLTSWAAYHRVVQAKRAAVDAARADLQSALITAEHDIWMSVDACKQARDQFADAKDLLNLSQKAFDAAQQMRGNGLDSSLDLLQAQQALAQARYSLVNARARLFTSAADLAFATGETAMGSVTGG